jgi:hypothetical protein
LGCINSTFPTGHTYTTTPGGSFFFPQLAIPTGELIIPPTTGPPNPNRGLSPQAGGAPRCPPANEPERKTGVTALPASGASTRARIADEQRRHQAWLAATSEPPPF